MSFSDILAKYRIVSFSERDKGERFERLMQAFLKTAPLYAGLFEHVWLWADFPCKDTFSDRDTETLWRRRRMATSGPYSASATAKRRA